MFPQLTTRVATVHACAIAVLVATGCSGVDSSSSSSPPAGGATAVSGAGMAGNPSVAGTTSVAGSTSVAGTTSVGGAPPTGGIGPVIGGAATSGTGGGGSGSGGSSGAGGSGGSSGGAGSGGSSGAGGSGSGGTLPGTAPDPNQKKAAYVYGSVSENGTIPAPAGQEYDQMRLSDTSDLGCSQYKMEIENLGYSITEVYDRTTTFDLDFLNQYNVVIFGNHQKVMSGPEQAAIATWIANGGGLLAYSDSALGGKYDVVGISNTVGQKAVNSIVGQFGMQVLTDQGNGACAMKAPDDDTSPVTHADGRALVIEGEGEPVVCVDPNAGVKILIPFSSAAKVGQSGSVTTNNVGGGMTIGNPLYAALALKEQGKGRVMVQFDRQMIWNNGPGSSIQQRDNREIEKRIFLYLAHAL